MSTGALKTLTIEHLRGSVRPFSLSFEKSKKLTVIYGENGTGKSTICDAFEFLGSGRVGSIENRGLGKTSRYWPAIGKNLFRCRRHARDHPGNLPRLHQQDRSRGTAAGASASRRGSAPRADPLASGS